MKKVTCFKRPVFYSRHFNFFAFLGDHVYVRKIWGRSHFYGFWIGTVKKIVCTLQKILDVSVTANKCTQFARLQIIWRIKFQRNHAANNLLMLAHMQKYVWRLQHCKFMYAINKWSTCIWTPTNQNIFYY